MGEDEIKRKLYSLILIQNDTETLKQICLSIRDSVFWMGIIPYIALYYRAVQEFFEIELISQEFDSEVYDIRNSIKIFGEKYGKGKKRFLLSDEQQNEEFRNMLRFEFAKALNIHYNLGIYFDNNIHIIGNTQLIADICSMNDLSEDEKKQKAFSLGENMARVIRSVADIFEGALPSNTVSLNTELTSFYYADINTNSSLFFNPVFGKDVNLFMLHIASTLGFVKYVLEPVVGRDNVWLFRVKYLVTHYSYLGLRKLKSHLENNIQNATTNLVSNLAQILDMKEKLFPSCFRNCMMHYNLVDNDGAFAMDDSCFDNKKPLFGLVETCFGGLSYTELFDSITLFSNEIEEFLISQFSFQHLRIEKL